MKNFGAEGLLIQYSYSLSDMFCSIFPEFTFRVRSNNSMTFRSSGFLIKNYLLLFGKTKEIKDLFLIF